MTESTIEIHEFSTGIRPQPTVAGGWVSLGFTGQYMNVTIDPIPEVVERSIANREFAVAEGASSDQPAIIGRVVGTGDDTWSVVAIVTKGRDEKGRGASMYRFFLTQGSEKDGFKNLRLMLTWWENQERPIFHPFDIREIDKPHICDVEEISAKFHQVSQEAVAIPVNIDEPTLLTPQQEYDLQTINVLALKKYNTNAKSGNYQPFSWAYNVEALEKPERFLVIHAASEKAYQLLERAINKAPKLLISAAVTDEEALKSAIRGLSNNSQVKPDNVRVIVEALQNNQLTSEYWHSLFDAQGATTAINQKIYSPQMVRLITLRAIVIPETMLQFLSWLNIKPGQKADENQAVSLEFQKAIRSGLPKDKLANSIKSLLPELLKKSSKITPEGVKWLLVSNDSVWASGSEQFIEDILADLDLIFSHLKLDTRPSSKLYKCPPETWEILTANWKTIYYRKGKQEEYNSFAKLFESLEDSRLADYLKDDPLAAYFYQVSEGIVPKNIVKKAFPNYNDPANANYLGIIIRPKLSLPEKTINFILRNFNYIVLGIGIFSVLACTYLLVLEYRSGKLARKNNQNPTYQQTSSRTEITNDQITDDQIKKALKDFQTTVNAVNKIVNNIQQDNNIPTEQKSILSKDRILLTISQVICSNQQCFQFESFQSFISKPATEKSPPENFSNGSTIESKKKDFVKYIYNYQKDKVNGSEPDGIIGEKTRELLENEVRNQLYLPPSNNNKTSSTKPKTKPKSSSKKEKPYDHGNTSDTKPINKPQSTPQPQSTSNNFPFLEQPFYERDQNEETPKPEQ